MDYFKLRKIRSQLKKVNAWKSRIEKLSDQELKDKTVEFRERIANGESLDSLLPEAFAVVREADKRVLGMFPYDVQVMGGIVLHQGDVAEMNTGEGKTLTATMPLYLNALPGKGAYLITTNDYLATRDAEEMGQVYKFLGLTIGVPLGGDSKDKMTAREKRAIYASDIIYTTNSALGFDYLGQNLSDSADEQFLRPFNYAIIDEIDAILLDVAQTPLIISGAPRVQSNLYKLIDTFVTTLTEDVEYKFDDEKNQVWLTHEGEKVAERYLGLDNLYSEKNKDLVRHINLALRAHKTFIRDQDYVVRTDDEGKDEVVLLDRSTGRLMEMTRLQGGQHQAIEAKEHVSPSEETRAMASITYQNLFKMFQKLGGMTGTGKVAEVEFLDTYAMSVIKIPTNKKKIRKDLPDQVYRTLPEKIAASLEYVKKYHERGNPILVFTGSVEMSNIYSSLLLREGIAHNLLNANNAAREAQMIAESGQKGSVIVATSMAGRGTDIKLGPGVKELGGLIIVGTERMQNKRIDLQIRGRSGRQGDPGISKFFISLEDDVVKKSGPAWVRKYYKDYSVDRAYTKPKELKGRKFKKVIELAQNSSETRSSQSRQMTLEFAQSMNIQRSIIYQERDDLIQKDGLLDDEINNILKEVIENVIQSSDYNTKTKLYRYVLDNFSYHVDEIHEDFSIDDSQKVREFLWELATEELDNKRNIISDEEILSQFQRVCILKAVDENWVEQVDYLQQLRSALSGQYTSQKNPIVEYYQESYHAFDRMKLKIKEQIIRNLLLSTVEINKKGEIIMHFP